MKDLVIYGAGGFGREVAAMVKRLNKSIPKWNLLGFVDDNTQLYPRGTSNEYGVILGNIDFISQYQKPLAVVLAFGKPLIIEKVYRKIDNPNIDFPNLIGAEAKILDEDNFQMGKGNIICSYATMSCNVRLGNFNVFNNRCSVGHDAQIGDFNTFMTATRISGDTHIGTLNFFGVGSILLQGLTVGTQTTIAAGAVVMRKTKDNQLYMGNPAKKVEL